MSTMAFLDAFREAPALLPGHTWTASCFESLDGFQTLLRFVDDLPSRTSAFKEVMQTDGFLRICLRELRDDRTPLSPAAAALLVEVLSANDFNAASFVSGESEEVTKDIVSLWGRDPRPDQLCLALVGAVASAGGVMRGAPPELLIGGWLVKKCRAKSLEDSFDSDDFPKLFAGMIRSVHHYVAPAFDQLAAAAQVRLCDVSTLTEVSRCCAAADVHPCAGVTTEEPVHLCQARVCRGCASLTRWARETAAVHRARHRVSRSLASSLQAADQLLLQCAGRGVCDLCEQRPAGRLFTECATAGSPSVQRAA